MVKIESKTHRFRYCVKFTKTESQKNLILFRAVGTPRILEGIAKMGRVREQLTNIQQFFIKNVQ